MGWARIIDRNFDKALSKYLEEWIEAVNDSGAYGTWTWDVAFHPSEVRGIIGKHAKTEASAREYAKCPKCGRMAASRQEVENGFGFRNMGGMARPQSWCRKCRKS